MKTIGNKPVCPRCKSREGVVPILYGYPSVEAFEAQERGELVLGGCTVGLVDPEWFCNNCNYRFVGSIKRVLQKWCRPILPDKAYFRPYICQGNFHSADIFLVGINPAIPIFPSEMPFEKFVDAIQKYDRFMQIYKSRRIANGKASISRTRQGMNSLMAWIKQYSSSPIVETDVIPYPTPDLKALKREPKDVIDQAKEVFCDLVSLKEPSLIIFHGKKAVGLGIEELTHIIDVPPGLTSIMSLPIEDMEQKVPLITFSYPSGKKGHVAACRHLMYYGEHGHSYKSVISKLAALIKSIDQ